MEIILPPQEAPIDRIRRLINKYNSYEGAEHSKKIWIELNDIYQEIASICRAHGITAKDLNDDAYSINQFLRTFTAPINAPQIFL